MSAIVSLGSKTTPPTQQPNTTSVQNISENIKPSSLSGAAIIDLAKIVFDHFKMQPGSDLDPIVKALGGTIEIDETPHQHDADSIIVRGKADFTIYLSSFTSPLRDRFTIAHELGHYFLHSQVGQIPLKLSRYGSNRLEIQANTFAAGLLMPEDLFLAEMEKLQDSPEKMLSLAAKFHVSIPAAQIRFHSLKNKKSS